MICKNCGEVLDGTYKDLCRHCYDKIWYEKNKEELKKEVKEWYKNNKEKIKLLNQKRANEWRKNNIARCKLNHKNWRLKNREHLRKYRLNKEKIDILYKIRMSISGRIKEAIKNQYGNKAYKTIELLGCSISDCRDYLEKQFKPNMSWDNCGNKIGYWEIHHIIPCAHFDLKDPEQQRLCFHYTNLQPLWFEEHRKIGTKILE